MNITFEQLLIAKQERNKSIKDGIHSSSTDPFSGSDKQITIVGNPNISMIKTIMLGVEILEKAVQILLLTMMGLLNVVKFG